MYLLLNLCIATIPRCDSILELLQQSMNSESLATLVHHHQPEPQGSCHKVTPSQNALISTDKVCECSLVKFVFVTLEKFDAERFIGFRIQTTTLLSFELPLWNPAALKGPEPPYPRLLVG